MNQLKLLGKVRDEHFQTKNMLHKASNLRTKNFESLFS
jgi:hypothetical protein